MQNNLMERTREYRNSGAVLKVRLSNIRSRDPSILVLIFEGDTDVGPYEVWLSRIDDNLKYQPLAGVGKAQLLDLRRRLSAQPDLARYVYFFVDRDFDDLRGQQTGADLFCTEYYSMENYLVSKRVLASLLNDELRCDPSTSDREKVIALFDDVFPQFLRCMSVINQRLFRAKQLGISGSSIADTINQYVAISLETVTTKLDEDRVVALVGLDREPTPAECAKYDPEFAKLIPEERHRGKFHLGFFLRWIDLLAKEREQHHRHLFSDSRSLSFSVGNLTLRSLASRSAVPASLGNFVAGIRAASCA
jgi:hypothetical protein